MQSNKTLKSKKIADTTCIPPEYHNTDIMSTGRFFYVICFFAGKFTFNLLRK